jgi:hypothetical protein
MTNPQEGQTWGRPLKLVGTRSPQPEQSWLVNAGGTATTRVPAHSAVPARRGRNCAPPAAERLVARGWLRTMVATRRSSREMVSYSSLRG